MKLWKKIIVACVIIFFIPIIIVVSVGAIMLMRQINVISETYGVYEDGVDAIGNPMVAYSAIIKDSMKKLESSFEEDGSRITDIEYLDDVNSKFAEHHAYLYIRDEDGYVYMGNDNLISDVGIYLTGVGSDVSGYGGRYVSDGKVAVLIEQLKISYNGKEYIAYVVLDIADYLPEAYALLKRYAILLAVLVVVIMLFIILIVKQILITPITQLSKATHNIIEGDFDTPIRSVRNDEIGQLQRDFEEMRLHIKENSESQERNAALSKEMMSNISHDLKTPLTAIKGYAEGLRDGVADTPEKQQKYIKTIYAKACFMEELVNDLAYFSKIDNKTAVYNFSKIPIKDYILDCVEDLRMDMEINNIRFMESYQCDDGINVIIDPDEVKRVIKNIIGNAIKYMDKEEGEIRLRVLNDQQFVWITVEDNGRGIEKKDVAHVFDRFFRADSSRGTKQGGTGLGLAICKSVIEAHGGRIFADSVLGKGTVIRFSLPREIL